MITVNHLTKTYTNADGHPLQVLRDINCHVRRGDVISLIGPSGTGKSTFLRALNMLDPPTSGQIIVNGEDILAKGYDLTRLRRKMGMVFQSFNLFEHLPVLRNVTLAPMQLLGLSRTEAEANAMELLRKVGMAEKASAMPSQLSGGQKQRVAIARALAMKPEVILFDEPTSALDPTMVGEVQAVMRSLATEGMTMLIVTHEMKFARDISNRIFFMYGGYIHEDGPVDQIFNHPQRPETRAFIQRIRSLKFEIDSRTFDFYDMMSQIRQFCIRYAIADKMDAITHIVEETLLLLGRYDSAVHIEIAHSELDGSSSVAITHCGQTISPLDQPDADELAVAIIRGMSSDIRTDQTPDGICLTFAV